MAEELLRWINGLVYSQFGAEGLVAFSAHPWLYSLIAAGLALLAFGGGSLWFWSRMRRMGRSVRRDLGLLGSSRGRHCLRLARRIRRGGARLRRSIRRDITANSERRALLTLLERFTRIDLEDVLEQSLILIRNGDDRVGLRLHGLLEQQTRSWSEAGEGPEREEMQERIAATRQRLARITQANDERDRILRGLEDAASAVKALEGELAGLKLARNRALPEFRDRLNQLGQQLGYLKAAHKELDASE